MKTKLVANSILPTRFGTFTIYAFIDSGGKEHVALAKGKIKKKAAVPVRVHSRCLTGDTLASMRCDCRDQLEMAMKYVNRHGGIIVYLDQEGRGIGLNNKIKAYALQDAGMDTVEANYNLGFEEELRDYCVAAEILKILGVKTIKLLTNNPAKIIDLEHHGVKIAERIPLITKPNRYNRKYMETKRKKMNHLI